MKNYLKTGSKVRPVLIKESGVQDTGVHVQYCAKDVHNLISVQKYQEKEIMGQNIQVKNT